MQAGSRAFAEDIGALPALLRTSFSMRNPSLGIQSK